MCTWCEQESWLLPVDAAFRRRVHRLPFQLEPPALLCVSALLTDVSGKTSPLVLKWFVSFLCHQLNPARCMNICSLCGSHLSSACWQEYDGQNCEGPFHQVASCVPNALGAAVLLADLGPPCVLSPSSLGDVRGSFVIQVSEFPSSAPP